MSKKVPVRPAPAPRVRRAFLLLAIAIVSCSLLGACGKHAPADARSTGDHPVAVTTTVLQPMGADVPEWLPRERVRVRREH